MPIFLVNNWENHFKDNPTNEDNNKTMDQLIALFAPTVDLDTCLANSLNEQDTVFIGKSPNANRIIFFHHVTKLGGTRTMPDEKKIILVGTDSTSFPAQAPKESLFLPGRVRSARLDLYPRHHRPCPNHKPNRPRQCSAQ